MKSLRLPILTAAVLTTLLSGGCASQSDMKGLQADVDALRQMTEKAASDANSALQETALLKSDLAALRQSSESTSADAAATRKLLEQINKRLDGGSGSTTFK